MKKILFSFALSLMALQSFSQTSIPVAMTGNGDTITDTGTDLVMAQIQGTFKHVSVQAIFTKVSGTVAGKAVIYGSVDGTNFQTIASSSDTMVLANATTSTKIWVLDNSNYMYYKVQFTGTGTMSGIVKGYIFPSDPIAKHATTRMLSRYSNNIDTVANTGTKYLGLQIKSGYTTVTVQAIVTKLSGTAAGTVTLQGSNDGINYVTVSSSYSDAQTLSVSNTTTNAKLFVITGSPYAYYRLSYTGSGTMSCTLKGYLLPNK